MRGPVWSEEETAALRAGVAQHGHAWSRIAGSIPGRSVNALRLEWRRTHQELPPAGTAVLLVFTVVGVSASVLRGDGAGACVFL